MARRRIHSEQDDSHEQEETQLRETVAAAASRPTDLWIESQAAFFEHFEEMARRWLDRRREALDATRQSIDDMRRSSDLSDVFRIQQEWISGSMRRLAADLSELSGAALTLTHTATHQLGRGVEGAVHDTEQMSRDMLSAAGSKPRSVDSDS
jgi:hypothetical protein